MKQAKTIDEVISILDEIILESKRNQSSLGYFAALYRKVTIKVKEGIEDDYFEDGARMERLDVVFANRYIVAYYEYSQSKTTTKSWKKAFEISTNYWPIVLQHLLIGMNAHINLDLGIAAAEVSRGHSIEDLKDDFDKINDILSGLVGGVEQDLAKIWPTLKVLLKLTGTMDDLLIGFSMKIARDGAWKFANRISSHSVEDIQELIQTRDEKVVRIAKLVTHPGIIAKTLFAIIRIGESGSVLSRIIELET